MSFLKNIQHHLSVLYHSTENSHFKKNVLNALPFWIGAFITGLVSVLYAQLFNWAEMGTEYIWEHAKYLFFIVTPLCFVMAWWIVQKYAPYSRGSGIPQVVAAIELSNPKHNIKVNKLLSLRIVFIKIVSSLVMVLGGGAIGREGPTIQIAASIFRKINSMLPEWYPKISKQSMIVTGAAAGLASAFNTPLGGIVFAIEELTKKHFNFFKSALLTGVIIAGLTALNILGPYLYLGNQKISNIPLWIILIVIPLAALTGGLGNGMGNGILFIFKKKEKLKTQSHKALYVVACGLLVAAIAYFLDHRFFGSGKEIMLATLNDNEKLEWYLPILRIVGPIIAFSTGAAGGIFAPALSAGASIGAVVADWVNVTPMESNLLVLCGMVGFLTGITRSPFTSSILVIEMTNSNNIIFHLMLTALLANLVANMFSHHSFYDRLKDQYLGEILKGNHEKTSTPA